MKEKLIKDLSVARPIYKQLENMYLRIYAIEDKKPLNFPHPIILHIVLVVLYAIGVYISMLVLSIPITFVYNIFDEVPTMITLVFGLMFFIIGPLFFIKCVGKLRIKHYDKKIEAIQQEINAYIEANDCPELYCVPEDCRNYRATNYIYEALKNGRAETLKEAMIQYEQQKQIWILEDKLNQQMQHVERLQRDIGLALSTIR